jgi:serine/threonine-protein kinase
MNYNAILIAIIKVAVLCLAVVACIGLLLAFWLIPVKVRTSEATMPNLVGQSYESAVQLLNSAGLKIQPVVVKKSSADVPEGYVIEQDPPANFKVKENKPVRLTVSQGSEAIAVPDVAGKLLNEVDAMLKSAGFKRGRVAAVHSDQYAEVNMVIAQTPPPETRRPRGEAVHLVVSLGARPKILRLPDFRGQPIDEARALLESHGLKIGREEYKPHPEINQGRIISQQPPAGTLVTIGQVVDVEVSGSRRLQTDRMHRIPSIKHQVSPTGKLTKRVQIIIEDERGTRAVVDSFYQPGMRIETLPQTVFGKATVRIYEDKELVKTEAFDL